jgi:hypothetical protein
MGHHFSQAHAAHTKEGWKIQSRRLNQTWRTVMQVEREEENRDERQEEEKTMRKSDRELATNYNHKLYVQDIYLFDGENSKKLIRQRRSSGTHKKDSSRKRTDAANTEFS